MNEQLIAQLQLLIELAKTGEEFEIKDRSIQCRFNEGYLEHKPVVNSTWVFLHIDVCSLSKMEIIRKPWKPKVGEMYWSWCYFHSKGIWFATIDSSSGDQDVICQFAFGNCFRTKQECELHTEVRDKLIAMRKEYE